MPMLRDELLGVVRWLARLQHRPVVFVFHDVADSQIFEDCISEISANRHVVPLEAIASSRENDTCAITFDDGRRSVADVAHAVLVAAKLPYTVFVCTDVLMGGPVPWFIRVDHLVSTIGVEPLRREWALGQDWVRTKRQLVSALKEFPLDRVVAGLTRLEREHRLAPPPPERLFMTPAQVRKLAAAGVSFGAHTCRHPILSKLSVDGQRWEIETSCASIERLVGSRPSHFAYPNGSRLDFDATTKTVLRDVGCKFGYTTMPGYVSPSDDPLALPRIALSDDASIHRALRQLAPWLSRVHAREGRVRTRVQTGAARPGAVSPRSHQKPRLNAR
jgi:peptidoglycan/xylan/chitin deacetylase (PgdA/CDA1 family)